MGFASEVGDRTWTQSVGSSGAWFNDGSRESLEIRKLITDQVATTPCTDCLQE